MIHDAMVEVTCDSESCIHESVFVRLEWAYKNMHESSGYYDHRDSTIEEILIEENPEWLIKSVNGNNKNKHYCSLLCLEWAENNA
jgi:hypothetical protein